MHFMYSRHISIDTIVIGAGPTGLATSYYLSANGISHFVLEKEDHVGANWSQVWHNFRLAMPASAVNMPNQNAADIFGPNTHLTREELLNFFHVYAIKYSLPIRLSCPVISIQKDITGQFYVFTKNQLYTCNNVICCIGPRQEPRIPKHLLPLYQFDNVTVMHSNQYRSSSQFLPTDKILVVGSGLSALCITNDLAYSKLSVSLACGLDDEQISMKNPHINREATDTKIIPTLDSLDKMGVPILGKLDYLDQKLIYFGYSNNQTGVPISDFNVIILATGFEPSYSTLNQLIKLKPEMYFDIHNLKNGETHIPGFFICGIPEGNQQTVIISDGTLHAKNIVDTIIFKQLDSVYKSKPLFRKSKL